MDGMGASKENHRLAQVTDKLCRIKFCPIHLGCDARLSVRFGDRLLKQTHINGKFRMGKLRCMSRYGADLSVSVVSFISSSMV